MNRNAGNTNHDSSWRPIKHEELALIRAIVQGTAFASHVSHLGEDTLVKVVDEVGSLLLAENGLDVPHSKVGPEAEAVDLDGDTIHALLFESAGKVVFLEYYKDAGSAPQRPPPLSEWKFLREP
jgi:hypothetical protein